MLAPSMAETFTVDSPSTLFPFLSTRLTSWGKNTLRQRIDLGCVRINGTPVSGRNHPLEPGDEVTVAARTEGTPVPRAVPNFVPLFLDDDLVAIDKPAGLLSVPTQRAEKRTALAIVRSALAGRGGEGSLWPLHRLDRETSGVLLSARNRTARAKVLESWKSVRKTYLAVVHGRPDPAEGVVDQALLEGKNMQVRVGQGPGSKPARTHYKVLESKGELSLLEVLLDTGRRQQIRAHLAHLGHPIVGDERRGAAAPRMGLHALRLELPHPKDGRALVIDAPVPRAFRELF